MNQEPVSAVEPTSRTPGYGRGIEDVRDSEAFPPLRTLADFLPPEPMDSSGAHREQGEGEGTTVVVKCPFCDEFEGDELAVSHHVEKHLS
jgi:hypothetical protein